VKHIAPILILCGLLFAVGYAQTAAAPAAPAAGEQAAPSTAPATPPPAGTAAPATGTPAPATGTPPAPPSGIGGLLQSPLMLILLMFVIFYFVLFVPRQRERKKQAELLAALKPGQRIMMMGGIYGTITRMKDTTIMVKVADGLEVEVDRTAVNMKAGGEQK
jgi:preprotein translocase subunit YajC